MTTLTINIHVFRERRKSVINSSKDSPSKHTSFSNRICVQTGLNLIRNKFSKLLIIYLLISNTTVASETPLRIVTEELPPYNYSDGRFVMGMSTEIVKKMVDEAGIKHSFEVLPWPRSLKIARKEPNVLIYSIFRSQERETQFQWLWKLAHFDYSVFALPASNFPFKALPDISVQRMGVLRDSAQYKYLNSFSNLNEKNLIIGTSYTQLYQLLQKRRIDLLLAPDLFISHINRKLETKPKFYPKVQFNVRVEPNGVYAALSKKTRRRTYSKLLEAAERLESNGEFCKIRRRYGVETDCAKQTKLTKN